MRNHGRQKRAFTVLTQTGIKLSKPKGTQAIRDHVGGWGLECYRRHSINIPENSACLRYRFTANKNGHAGTSLRIRRVC